MNPLSAIFGAGVAVRNALYDRGTFKVRKLARPVVSVGNISVGGSGKTPFVIALGELLKERGIAFDVLSRGYRRQSSTITVVDPQGAPEEFGDEPLLIARNLQVPVIVGADRHQAGLLAEQKFASRLHLLDDGFQHRRLHRDFDIVMLPASDLKGTLLPVGRLREPVAALRRADAVVTDLNDIEEMFQRSLPLKAANWRVRRELKVDQGAGKAVAFCGIARAKRFFAQLNDSNIVLADNLAFPDHHRYSQADIERLIQLKTTRAADSFVTTEKDLINLGRLAGQLQPLRIARLSVRLEDPAGALNQLLRVLEERCGCRF